MASRRIGEKLLGYRVADKSQRYRGKTIFLCISGGSLSLGTLDASFSGFGVTQETQRAPSASPCFLVVRYVRLDGVRRIAVAVATNGRR
jgi:hypothetical protein